MRVVFLGAAAVLSLAANAGAQGRDAMKSVGAMIQQPETTRIGDAELSGLPADAGAEPMTIESAYTLALRRVRPGEGRPEFGQLREARVGGKPAGFRDPSADLLELLATAASVENASRAVAARSGLLGVLRELVKGGSSGLGPFEIDQAADGLERDRLAREERLRAYRDKLDALKVTLGLPARSPVVLDRGPIAAFGATFEGLVRWSINPRRELAELDVMLSLLPSLPQPTIGDHPVFPRLDRDPSALEGLLRVASDAAIKARDTRDEGADAATAELVVRARVRRMVATRSSYQGEIRRAVLLLRLRDRAVEALAAPPQAGVSLPGGNVAPIVEVQGQILANQDRLVALWASYLADKLALDRALGVLAATDWDGFVGQFNARHEPTGLILPPPDRER